MVSKKCSKSRSDKENESKTTKIYGHTSHTNRRNTTPICYTESAGATADKLRGQHGRSQGVVFHLVPLLGRRRWTGTPRPTPLKTTAWDTKIHLSQRVRAWNFFGSYFPNRRLVQLLCFVRTNCCCLDRRLKRLGTNFGGSSNRTLTRKGLFSYLLSCVTLYL